MVESFLTASARGAAAANWSSINAGEVYYQLARHRGQEFADTFWRDVVTRRTPLNLYSATNARVRRAARLKARFPVAYADAFAMALALELHQPLVSGDREIRNVADEAGLILEWLG